MSGGNAAAWRPLQAICVSLMSAARWKDETKGRVQDVGPLQCWAKDMAERRTKGRRWEGKEGEKEGIGV